MGNKRAKRTPTAQDFGDGREGTGRYGFLIEGLRQAARAEGVALIVFKGSRGHGFSVDASPALLRVMPEILRVTADIIERDAAVASGDTADH